MSVAPGQFRDFANEDSVLIALDHHVERRLSFHKQRMRSCRYLTITTAVRANEYGDPSPAGRRAACARAPFAAPAERSAAASKAILFFSTPEVQSHAGEWVAIVGQKVVAAGKDLATVHAAVARLRPAVVATFYRVPPDAITI